MLNLLLADPSTLQVGSVEGLLLLAEWVPYGIHEVDSSAGIEHRNLSTFEDNMAWSLIGQAVRHAYLLRLDLASFREKVPGESQELEDRKRLAWMCKFSENTLRHLKNTHCQKLFILLIDRYRFEWGNLSGRADHHYHPDLQRTTFPVYSYSQMLNTATHLFYKLLLNSLN